jgi:hypothetical protein
VHSLMIAADWIWLLERGRHLFGIRLSLGEKAGRAPFSTANMHLKLRLRKVMENLSGYALVTNSYRQISSMETRQIFNKGRW